MTEPPEWIGHPPPGDAPSDRTRPRWLPETRHSRLSEDEPQSAVPVTPGDMLAAYDWQPGGVCFRCHDVDRLVAHVATLKDRDGSTAEVMMCGSCLLREEERRMLRAQRAGSPYAPGRIGLPPD